MIASKVHATLLPFYLCALLISCGGGGGDDSLVAQPPPAPPPPPITSAVATTAGGIVLSDVGSDGMQRVATPATQVAIDGRFDPVGAGLQLLKGGIDLLTGVPLPAATLIAPSGASVLSVAATEVLSLSSETDILVVTGDADDELLFSDGGQMLTGQTMIDGRLFNVYMNLNAVVQVEADIIQGP